MDAVLLGKVLVCLAFSACGVAFFVFADRIAAWTGRYFGSAAERFSATWNRIGGVLIAVVGLLALLGLFLPPTDR